MGEIDNIDEIIKQIKDDDLRYQLSNIKLIVKKIWTPNIRIIKGYTGHDIEHSDRVAGHILKILGSYKNDKLLSDKELFLLSSAICLHDIGMQCDIKKYNEIKEKAEKLGAIFDLEIEAESSMDYSPIEQNMIRENHHYLSAAWIGFSRSNRDQSKETPLDNSIKNIPGNMIQDLMDICMYHSKLLFR